MTDADASSERDAVATQETLTHMQRELEQMHEVLLAQQQQIDGLRVSLRRVEDRLEQQATPDALPPALEERPPHY